jgi:hypothetical protein
MNTATDASFWLFETPHTARRLNAFDSWIVKLIDRCFAASRSMQLALPVLLGEEP